MKYQKNVHRRQTIGQTGKERQTTEAGRWRTDKEKTVRQSSLQKNNDSKLKTIPTFRLNDYKLATLNLHTHIHCKGHF